VHAFRDDIPLLSYAAVACGGLDGNQIFAEIARKGINEETRAISYLKELYSDTWKSGNGVRCTLMGAAEKARVAVLSRTCASAIAAWSRVVALPANGRAEQIFEPIKRMERANTSMSKVKTEGEPHVKLKY